MAYLANWIADDMANRGLTSRDYVILVRQRADDYYQLLSKHLAQKCLSVRNEAVNVGAVSLQDLLTDDLVAIFIKLYKLGLQQRNPAIWTEVVETMQYLRNIDQADHQAFRALDNQLSVFIDELRGQMQEPFNTLAAESTCAAIIKFIDLTDVRSAYTRYGTGDLLDITVAALKEHSSSCAAMSQSWQSCIEEFEGVHHLPLMTIHKSKGLEFDTVLFLGLDDNAWWAHSAGNPEGMSTFFVALSRARQRIIFSFCEERGNRNKVADLFSLLAQAGVKAYNIEAV